jgi:hypothetical protein
MVDRFDLYGALYMLCVRWHSGQWSRGYRLLGRLYNAGYRPGLTVRNGHGFESDEQRNIYKQLLKHRNKL